VGNLVHANETPALGSGITARAPAGAVKRTGNPNAGTDMTGTDMTVADTELTEALPASDEQHACRSWSRATVVCPASARRRHRKWGLLKTH
jgi:hypothetical protein